MNSKNQGRRVLVVLAGLGFLILVGLLAPPAQFTVTGVKVKTKTAIQRQLLPPASTIYFNQNFETGIAPFTVVTGSSMSSPFAFWQPALGLQCANSEADNCVAYYHPGNCQYPGGNTSHLYSPTFVPTLPSGATTLQNVEIELDYTKTFDSFGDSVVVYFNNLSLGGSVILEVLPDTPSNAFVNRKYTHPGSINDTWQVELRAATNSIGNTNSGGFADNIRAKAIWAASMGCESLILYSPGAETANQPGPSLPTPGEYATYFPSQEHWGHQLVYLIDGNQVPPGPPDFQTIAANLIGTGCPSSCSMMDPNSPTVASIFIPYGEAFSFAIPEDATPGWIYWMQALCETCQKVSRPTPIVVY